MFQFTLGTINYSISRVGEPIYNINVGKVDDVLYISAGSVTTLDMGNGLKILISNAGDKPVYFGRR